MKIFISLNLKSTNSFGFKGIILLFKVIINTSSEHE